jgi:hypothetical protein
MFSLLAVLQKCSGFVNTAPRSITPLGVFFGETLKKKRKARKDTNWITGTHFQTFSEILRIFKRGCHEKNQNLKGLSKIEEA